MSIATLSGVALRPGISLNGRYYSPEMVADAVARAQERLADPDADLFNMLTHHDAEDDSELIVGRITNWKLDEDGSALYDAVMPDTPEAHKILNLIAPEDEDPYLKGVSIRGYWLGPITRTTVDGQSCDTAEGLELDGLDFTKSPGVQGARVDNVHRTTPAPVEASTGRVRHRIYESVQEARVTVTEDAPAAAVTETSPTGDTAAPAADVVERWADHGYTDAGKRWPLDTPKQAREAWHQLRRPAVAETLTAAQLRRTRERATKALQRHGVEVLPNGWLLERAQPTPAPVREYLDWYDGPISVEPEPVGSFTARIDNGVVCVSISSWAIDPHDLTRVARAAMAGAADAMDGLDPDMDGDVDTDGVLPGENATQRRPSATETAPAAAGVAEEAPADKAPVAPVEPSPDADAASVSTTDEEGEPGMAEPTSDTTAAPTAPTFTFDQVKDLFGSFGAGFAQAQAAPQLATAGAPAESAPAAAAPVVETTVTTNSAAPAAPAAPVAPVVEKSQAELIAEAVEAGRRAALQDLAESGVIPRKGAVVAPAGVRESDIPEDLDNHRPNEKEWKAVRRAMGAELAADFGIPMPQDA